AAAKALPARGLTDPLKPSTAKRFFPNVFTNTGLGVSVAVSFFMANLPKLPLGVRLATKATVLTLKNSPKKLNAACMSSPALPAILVIAPAGVRPPVKSQCQALPLADRKL